MDPADAPTARQSTDRIWDFHVHYFDEESLNHLGRYVADDDVAHHLGEMIAPHLSEWGPVRDAFSAYRKRAETLGIRRSVIFGLTDTARGCRCLNDRVAGVVRSCGDAAVGFGAVPLAESAEIEDELRRLDADLGFAGVKIYPSMSNLTFLADPVLQTLELAADLKLIVLADCSFACWDAPHFFGSGNKFYHLVEALGQLRERPRVVAAHLGGGLAFCHDLYLQFYGERALDEIWFDISPSFPPSMIRAAVETVSEDRLLFGSDYPISAGDENLRSVRRAGLADRSRRRILWDNAEHLLGG